MYTFWVVVWTPKVIFAYTLLLPTCYAAQISLLGLYRSDDVAEANPQLAHGARWLEPPQLIALGFACSSWIVGAIAFMADTLLFYQVHR